MASKNLYEAKVHIEAKDFFIDVRKTKNGVNLSISEVTGSGRNSVLIPLSGLDKLRNILDEVSNLPVEPTTSVSRPRKSRVFVDPEVLSRSVYVSGLPWNSNENDLTEHFSAAGEVVKSVILRRYRRGNPNSSMGCGVVEFATPEIAAAAIVQMNDTELGGRKIRCREDRNPVDEEEEGEGENEPAGPISTEAPQSRERKYRSHGDESNESKEVEPNKVFVSSLSWTTTKEELAQFFSEAGAVVSAEVLTSKKGRSLGSGIVEYVNPGSAERAITLLTGKELTGRVISVRKCYK